MVVLAEEIVFLHWNTDFPADAVVWSLQVALQGVFLPKSSQRGGQFRPNVPEPKKWSLEDGCVISTHSLAPCSSAPVCKRESKREKE